MRRDTVLGEEGYMEWHLKIENALEDLDRLGGILVTVAAGNDGRERPPGRTDAYMPNILSARHGSPLIVVGAVNNYGQLARLSSPGSLDVPITCFAAYVLPHRTSFHISPPPVTTGIDRSGLRRALAHSPSQRENKEEKKIGVDHTEMLIRDLTVAKTYRFQTFRSSSTGYKMARHFLHL